MREDLSDHVRVVPLAFCVAVHSFPELDYPLSSNCWSICWVDSRKCFSVKGCTVQLKLAVFELKGFFALQVLHLSFERPKEFLQLVTRKLTVIQAEVLLLLTFIKLSQWCIKALFEALSTASFWIDTLTMFSCPCVDSSTLVKLVAVERYRLAALLSAFEVLMKVSYVCWQATTTTAVTSSREEAEVKWGVAK